MSLKLDIDLQNPRHTTLESLRVVCSITNGGAAPVQVPGEDDQTGALTFSFYDAKTGTLVRRANGLSHQAMMSRSRIDYTPTLDAIPPGGSLTWTIDLASYHYTLPAGDFEVEATLDFPPAEISLTSRRLPVQVSSARIESVFALHDNPVLEGTALLIAEEGGRLHLRQHNHSRPLAAWYNCPLDVRPAAGSAFLVAASYFDDESFEPFFSKWILYEEGGQLVAREHEEGEPTQAERRAARPPAGVLCKSAFVTLTGQIFAFFQAPGVLRGYRFDPGALAQVFEQPLPAGVPEVRVRSDDDNVHVLVAHQGLVHHKFKWNGQPDGSTRIVRSGMVPVAYDYDETDRVVKGIFRDSAASPSWMIVRADEDGVVVRHVVLRVPGTIREIDFDRSPRERFVIVFSTSNRRLYLVDEERGPVLLASGEERFFPHVIARRATYVGHYRADRGYRFSTVRFRGHGALVPSYELEAWGQP